MIFALVDRSGPSAEPNRRPLRREPPPLDPVAYRRRLWSRSLLREEAAAYLSAAVDDVELVVDGRGKPHLAPPHDWLSVSVARSAGLCAVALSGDTEVGIDLEALRPAGGVGDPVTLLPRARALAVAAAPAARRRLVFLEQWTAHEAELKSAGVGFGEALPESATTVRVAAPAGYVASVAARSEGFRVRVRHRGDA